MNQLASFLAEAVRTKLANTAGGSEGATEVRLIFHGPPLELLEEVYELLIRARQPGTAWGEIPVLLQVPALPDGLGNPAIGASGRCDESHLLNLRNSPTQSSYVALVPPGQHSIRSVSSTTDEFGVAASSNGGNVPFEDWWADEFIQSTVLGATIHTGLPPQQIEDARRLAEVASRAADEIDPDKTSRRAAWRLLSRIFSAVPPAAGLSPGHAISLACGMPPMADGTLSAKEQSTTLEKIADAMSDGFKAGVARAQESSSEGDSFQLDEFLLHVREACDLPTAFERATPVFYGPGRGLDLAPAPGWWAGLTVEKWTELLTEETASAGDITIECTNALLPLGKGMPVLVSGEVSLAFRAAGQEPSNVVVALERTPGGPIGKDLGNVSTGEDGVFIDVAPPLHRSPMRYKASAPGYKPGTLKVVSLASWAPGVLIACRLARKLSPPRKPTRRAGRGGPDWESSVSLPGAGRYELLVFVSPGIDVDREATGTADDSVDRLDGGHALPVRLVREGQHQIEVEADGNYQLDIRFTRAAAGGATTSETCRVFLVCEDVEEEGCRSEFERLIRSNRRHLDNYDAKAIVQLNRSARSSSLQDWMLAASDAGMSYMPIVLADDYVDTWVQPEWGTGTGPLFSKGRFLQDPRPPASEFNPPPGFVEARKKIAARIRGDNDQSGLIEAAPLGQWLLGDEGFRSEVEIYLDAYQAWLAADPDVACWVDAIAVTSVEPDGRTLSRVPDAILLSPLHPLRVSWQAVAQSVLLEAEQAGRPCPAASVLDPDCIPDVLTMSLRAPSGIEKVDFLAVENGTDYWSVLWNADRLGRLPLRSRLAPFGEGFGVSVGGISMGFSAAQVARALEDVTDLLSAKPVVSITVASAGGTTDACNEGLVGWCADRYREGDKRTPRQSVGPRLVEIYDTREEASRPDDATIANLSEDTRNSVRWYEGQPAGSVPDLGIIAQLDMSEPGGAAVANRSPISHGGLIRHRVRRQLPGAFLSESRQSLAPPPSGDVLADKVASCIASMESLGDRRTGLQFAPNVNAVRDMLEIKRTDFVAVSSSAIDPACFLGGWLEGAYLWDYDLPSYSHRAGDTNGYYLLSQVKDADRDSLAKAMARLPGCDKLEPARVQELLLEVARRGIPTIRGLAGDDSGATGDLGLFVAVRLLQDRFRLSNVGDSLLPVIGGEENQTTVSIIVPVDPFRGYLDDIGRTLRKDRKDSALTRPDLLVIGVAFSGEHTRIHLTPVEVKCRPGSTFPATEVADALEQARSMSRLLSGMLTSEGQPRVWKLAFQHLLLSFVGFGMRVYSQHADVVGHEAKWASFHERIAAAILGGDDCVTIDERGRLVIIDDAPISAARDRDGDGFEETIVIGREDAGLVVAGDPLAFYDSVRAKVGDWGLLPSADAARHVRASIASEAGSLPAAYQAEIIHTPIDPVENPEQAPIPIGVDAELEAMVGDEPTIGGVILSIGRTTDGFQPRDLLLNLSDTSLNQLNMGVVGDLGTGKTQLLKSLILQISTATAANRGIKPRILIFDYKRDYSSDEFVAATGARVVRPHKLPLNLFDTSTLGEATAPWLDRFRFFADVLDKIYSGIGPVQREKLKRAVKGAYEAAGAGPPPTLYDVHAAYSELLDGKSDSPMAIIDDLVDMEVFAPNAAETQPFDQFLDGVVVIALDMLGQDDRSKNMLVAVMLNMFYENMLRTPKRPFIGKDPQLRAIDSYLLVDEADNIMRYEFDVLRKLLLQGREFGTGVILASQYLRHFKVNATDYREPLLTWFVHKVPNVTPAELSALGLVGTAAEMAQRVKSLQNHQCLYKSFNVDGEVIRGLPFFQLVQQAGQKS